MIDSRSFRKACVASAGGAILFGLAALPAAAQAAWDAPVETAQLDLSRLSIEELADVEITSVSKRPERLGEAAASVYVLSHGDLRRSGVQTFPEALRMAPNLSVARVDALDYAISARGLSGFESSNKLLVLIDGRSVYSPFFAGVEWSQQHVLIDDVERIEVISGPGGTLYGANAVNGVVNVISRSSADTQGLLVNLTAGTTDSTASARYGGRLGETGAFRVYATGYERGDLYRASGEEARDGWRGFQVGFRSDFDLGHASLTVQGDLHRNDINLLTGQPASGDGHFDGENLLARYERRLEGGAVLSVQAYYDRYERRARGVYDTVETVDLEAQHAFEVGRHRIVAGGGYRAWRDDFRNLVNAFTLDPLSRELGLGNVFVQDQIALRDDLTLTMGLKAEHNSFTGLDWAPNVRLAWRVSETNLVWGAVSRAFRNPSRLDRELVFPGILVKGGFQPEVLIAYELGWRGRPTERLSASATIFRHDYDGLRSNERPAASPLPLWLGNGLEGETWGVEAWADYEMTPRWRLSAGLNSLGKEVRRQSWSRDASFLAAGGVDPDWQAVLRSQAQLTDSVDFDVRVRAVSGIEDTPPGGVIGVGGYAEADARVAWRVTENVELSVAGFDLLHDHHPEAAEARRTEVGRRFQAGLRWTF
jgi:iron complex outermembrane receptor protein